MFQQEGSEIATPLFSLIGTSNEFIEEDEGLEAFYNRFILRYEVGYLQEAGNFAAMLDLNPIDPAQVPKLGFDELKQLQNTCCQNVTFTELTKENLVKIWHQLIEDGLRPSDRQFRDSTKLVKAMAVLDGRKATEPSDLDILRHSLWEDPEERQQIASIVRKFCTDSVKGKCDSLMTQAKEIYNNAMREQDPDGGIEATKKFKQIGKRLRELKDQNPSKSQMLEEGLAKVQSLNSEVQNICLGV